MKPKGGGRKLGGQGLWFLGKTTVIRSKNGGRRKKNHEEGQKGGGWGNEISAHGDVGHKAWAKRGVTRTEGGKNQEMNGGG